CRLGQTHPEPDGVCPVTGTSKVTSRCLVFDVSPSNSCFICVCICVCAQQGRCIWALSRSGCCPHLTGPRGRASALSFASHPLRLAFSLPLVGLLWRLHRRTDRHERIA